MASPFFSLLLRRAPSPLLPAASSSRLPLLPSPLTSSSTTTTTTSRLLSTLPFSPPFPSCRSPLAPLSVGSVRFAGHNKWSKIHRAKSANDEGRSQKIVKHIREIISVARQGGADPAVNPRLSHLLDRARAFQIPRANIESALQKAQGKGADASALVHVVYEGHGPKGIAIVIEAVTDNKNRTVGQIRSVMNKNGGNLGAQGSVEWMFEKKGLLLLQRKLQTPPLTMLELMEKVLEFDIEDANELDDDQLEVVCDPTKLFSVKTQAEAQGLKVSESEVAMLAKTPAAIPEDDEETHQAMNDLVAALNALDDVVRVHTNLA